MNERASHAQSSEPTQSITGAPSAPQPGPDDTMKLLSGIWRAAAGTDAPTLLQLIHGARVRRVDVDAISGYVAVIADDDTHRALGVRPEWVAPLVAALTGRSAAEVDALLAKGPAHIEPRLQNSA